MTVRRRLSALERRLPAPRPQGPEPEAVALPPLAAFRALTLEQQWHLLLGWEPASDGVVGPPACSSPAGRTEQDWGELLDAQERAGRDVLLPYVECLPLSERIDLWLGAVRTLPPSQIWRLKVLRFACRPEWKRRLEGRPQPRTEGEDPGT
jgi:hypothetical protein